MVAEAVAVVAVAAEIIMILAEGGAEAVADALVAAIVAAVAEEVEAAAVAQLSRVP
jgi:hypothetical protein